MFNNLYKYIANLVPYFTECYYLCKAMLYKEIWFKRKNRKIY